MYQFCSLIVDVAYQNQRLEQFYQETAAQQQSSQQWRSFAAKQVKKVAEWLEPTPSLKEQVS